jgi:Cu+-exporting ATPase
LVRADVGIAIGAGTDIAIESADVVLMKSDLLDVVTAIQLSKSTIRNIKQNLFWAFFYNAIGIPLAAGAFYSLFGWKLNPMFGAAAMSMSSVCVVSNALRLKFFKPYDMIVKNQM